MFSEEFMYYVDKHSDLFVRLHEEDLKELRDLLNSFASDFNIKRKSTELMLVDEYPQAYMVFFVSKKVEGMSDESLKMYKSHLGRFLRTVCKPVEQITTNDIRAYLFERSREVSDGTVDDIKRVISSFMTWCVDNDYIIKNPIRGIGNIKVEQKQRQALNEDELEQLRSGCKSVRDEVIVETIYSTGCRASELAKMKISDIDFRERTVLINGKGKKQNVGYLNAKACAVIEKYLSQRTDNVDSLIYSTKTKRGLGICGIENVVSQIKERVNLTKPCTPHVIRHTTATIALKRGMPIEEVSRMLGHSSVETTMIYAEVNKQKLKYDHSVCVV